MSKRVQSVIRQPMLFSVVDAWEQTALFASIIKHAPGDIPKLVKICMAARSIACLRLLTQHALNTNRVDQLVYLLMDECCLWYTKVAFCEVFHDLLCAAKAATIEHVIHAANPQSRNELAETLDFDLLWRLAIQKHIQQKDLRRAYESLLRAGSGFLYEEIKHNVAYHRSFTPSEKEFLLAAQDWRSSDTFFPTYGRADDFAGLVRLVWDAHRSSKTLPAFTADDCIGVPSFEVAIATRGEDGHIGVATEMRPTPHRGLIARLACGGVVATESHYQIQFVQAPSLRGARLTSEGAMLQQMILHYQERIVSSDEAPRPKRSVSR